MAVYRNQISEIEVDEEFLNHVLEGLSRKDKKLSSMYFYDDTGSRIFQEIMAMPEYYLTGCEFEVLSMQGGKIGERFAFNSPFRLIELGAGDGSKTFKLIENLLQKKFDFEYMAVDVSAGALEDLEMNLLDSGLKVDYEMKVGDYFEVMSTLPDDRPAVYLFLGANIGNYHPIEAENLVRNMAEQMRSGDKLLIGFDLKKNPLLIQQAYFDPHGITKRFNLNLLQRINKELDGNFRLDQFDFYCHYNPDNGEVNSFIVSLKDQKVNIAGREIHFHRFELIHTELSRKYDLEQIESLAERCGFKHEEHFLDCKHFFADSLWTRL